MNLTCRTSRVIRIGQKHLQYNKRLRKSTLNVEAQQQRQFSTQQDMRHESLKMDDQQEPMRTQVLPIKISNIGKVTAISNGDDVLDEIGFELLHDNSDVVNLRLAAEQLKHSDVPVAFPTETVYGLGADATRSAAVKGIYKAKQRPADNPLIVHFASLRQLRDLLTATTTRINGHEPNGVSRDSIPEIYRPLITKFWPGPLTIILPNPRNSPLAPEVTAGLQTFGARIPSHILALALIKLADVPIAAPSANASTKPSPTAAEHVAYDLDGRIETILDGGPCDVGVESTVVDGLQQPPLVLRPGGISLQQLRSCPGWENAQIGYKNASESGSQPKAPGMKYRHYSPNAPLVLYEQSRAAPSLPDLCTDLKDTKTLGLITTKRWRIDANAAPHIVQLRAQEPCKTVRCSYDDDNTSGFKRMLQAIQAIPDAKASLCTHQIRSNGSKLELLEIALGGVTADIARGIFSALRELDKRNVDIIFVEGIDDLEGDTAAAVMNRLRKAAEVKVGD